MEQMFQSCHTYLTNSRTSLRLHTPTMMQHFQRKSFFFCSHDSSLGATESCKISINILRRCNLDRPSGASSTGRMYIVNHFAQKSILGLLDVPYTDVIDATNAATGVGSIGAQAAVCLGTWGHLMKFVLVDFASKGMKAIRKSLRRKYLLTFHR